MAIILDTLQFLGHTFEWQKGSKATCVCVCATFPSKKYKAAISQVKKSPPAESSFFLLRPFPCLWLNKHPSSVCYNLSNKVASLPYRIIDTLSKILLFLVYLQSNEIIGKCAKPHFAKAQHIKRSNFPTIAFLQTHLFLAVDLFPKRISKKLQFDKFDRSHWDKYYRNREILLVHHFDELRWHYEFPSRKIERCRKYICPIQVLWQNVRNLEGKQTIFLCDRRFFDTLSGKVRK